MVSALRIEHASPRRDADERDELGATAWPAWPTTVAGASLRDAGPRRLVGAVPHRPDAAGQQVGDPVADPGVGVDAVGDRADRHLLDGARRATGRGTSRG